MTAAPQKLRCIACGEAGGRPFLEIPRSPVHCNVLWPTRDAALAAPRGAIALAFCGSCGHVWNHTFDPQLMEYTQAYENSLHFSPGFQKFAGELADRLIARYGLRGKDIIDIGCGKGDFLKLICARGDNRGVGFDPSYVPDPSDDDAGSRVRFVREFYSESHASTATDLVSCRHVLEHVARPGEFVRSVRRSIGDRPHTGVYFEVPNVLYTLRDMGIWDIIYEHCSYFSARSLSLLFAAAGFDVAAAGESFGGQYLSLDALPARKAGSTGAGMTDLREMERLVTAFSAGYLRKLELWRDHLRRIRNEGRRAVVWGGGSKGVTFLNALNARDEVEMMVDINPRKQGMFVPVTGQMIVGPEKLRSQRPDSIIIMNPLYREEIRSAAEGLGITAEYLLA